MLVIARDDIAVDKPLVAHLKSLGADVDERAIAGYAEMMQPSAQMQQPLAAFALVEEWLDGLAAPAASSERAPIAMPAAAARVDDAVEELPLWFGEGAGLFGVLARPAGKQPQVGVILLNDAGGSRLGPHGMRVYLCRQLARQGFAALRIDLGGLGDSPLPRGREPHHSYRMDCIPDVRAAAAELRRHGVTRVALSGLCSGAYLAYYTALDAEPLDRLILVNQQTFAWREGDSLEVTPLQNQYEMKRYQRSALSMQKWMKLLRGDVAFRHLAGVIVERGRFVVGSRLQALRARLPFAGTGSRVGDELRAMTGRGTEVLFLFSGDNPGITNLNKELGGSLRPLLAGGRIRTAVVDGPDHSFTARWATERLLGAMSDELRRAR